MRRYTLPLLALLALSFAHAADPLSRSTIAFVMASTFAESVGGALTDCPPLIEEAGPTGCFMMLGGIEAARSRLDTLMLSYHDVVPVLAWVAREDGGYGRAYLIDGRDMSVAFYVIMLSERNQTRVAIVVVGSK